jgi:hypothetical protein
MKTTTSFSLNGKSVYLTPTGLKVTARGKVTPVGRFLGALSKGEARRARKALRKAGRKAWAGAPRQAA